MTLFYYVYYINLIAWAIPPFRQYKTRYFYYFLVLALSDPLFLILYYTVHILPANYYVIISFLCVAALVYIPGQHKKLYKYILPALIYLFISIQEQYKIHLPVAALNQLIALIILFKHFMIDIKESETINLFFVAIIFYVISILQKMLFTIANVETGYLYILLGNFFQLFMCVYFIFFNLENSRRFALYRDKKIA